MPTAMTTDEMLLTLPRDELVIVQRLRGLIMECLPFATEKVYYGVAVPFYSRHRQICFIWPPSIFWGPKRDLASQKKKGVSLGFCQGNLMADVDGLLQGEGRKRVYVMYIHSFKEINDDVIRALLFEAGMIDDVATWTSLPLNIR